MDVLKLAILAFIAAGIVLSIAGLSAVQSILISGAVTAVVMVIAVIRSRINDKRPKPEEDDSYGPTIN
jgi:quinol-cytochrome oxidoreductase complex cytochrome b subunit